MVQKNPLELRDTPSLIVKYDLAILQQVNL